MVGIAISAVLWTMVVLLYVDRFSILVSDDPFDGGANLAQQFLATAVFVVWLSITLLLAAFFVVLWRQGRRRD